jgi:hypothetical protein
MLSRADARDLDCHGPLGLAKTTILPAGKLGSWSMAYAHRNSG